MAPQTGPILMPESYVAESLAASLLAASGPSPRHYPATDFLGEFYHPKRGDLILNPLDQRCPYWGLGDEIDRPETD